MEFKSGTSPFASFDVLMSKVAVKLLVKKSFFPMSAVALDKIWEID